MIREIKWIKADAEEYESSDRRFHILKYWIGPTCNYWQLHDRTTRREYIMDSLDDCKLKAEAILESEE